MGKVNNFLMLTFILRCTGPGAYQHLTNPPVPVRCGHLNAQYTHVEAYNHSPTCYLHII